MNGYRGWVALLVFGFAACGDDAGETSAGDGEQQDGGSDGESDGDDGDGDADADADGDGSSGDDGGDGDGGGEGVRRDQLIGTWLSGCRADATNYYGQNELVITETSFSNRYRQYLGDPSCSDASKQVVDSLGEDGPWTLGAVTAQGFTEFDAVVQRRDFELLDANSASAWSSGSGCGPFTANEVKDVTGLVCYGYTYPEVGGTTYSIVSLRDGELRFGELRSSDALTPEARPTTLDLGEGRGYSRQQ